MSVRNASFALLLAGCASVPKLLPATPQPQGRTDVMAQAGELSLRAVPNAWRGPPDMVAEHFTPIWVHLVNRGEQAYDVTYAQISLVDEQGRLYAPVPPGEVVRSLLGVAPPLTSGVRVASADSDIESPLLAQFGFGFGFGPAYDPYDPLANPYGPYGSNPYPPNYADAARNIVEQGLREGRLLPRTQAMGFLYFQRAYQAKQLHLRIQPVPENPSMAPLELDADFTVAP